MKKTKIPETEPKEVIFRLTSLGKYKFFIMAGLIPVIVFGLFLTVNALAGRTAMAGFMGSAKDMFFSLLWSASDKGELLSVIKLTPKDADEKNKLTASVAASITAPKTSASQENKPKPGKAVVGNVSKPAAASVAPKPEVKKEAPAKPAAVPKAEPVKAAECVPPFASMINKMVIFNEIAWAGAQGKSSDEWIELKNVSGAAVKLSGWRIINQAETLKIIFGATDEIPPGEFFLLERTDDDSVPGVLADRAFTGGIKNSDEKLMLLNHGCLVADEVSASAKWPGGDASEYRSAERGADYSWHSYSGSGSGGIMGTPRAVNSPPPALKPATPPPVPTPAAEDEEVAPEQPAPAVPKFYELKVILINPVDGTVKSQAEEIDCEDVCSASFKEGLEVGLAAYPSAGSEFVSWSGACSGSNVLCSIKMAGDKSVSAEFKKKTVAETPTEEPAPEQEDPSPVPESEPSPEPSPEPQLEPEPEPIPAAGHLFISEVQITGGSGETNKEFIELYNPTGSDIKLDGYRLVKRTKVGVIDVSIKSWTNDASATVPAHGRYLWANSAYASVYAPDASTSATIADDNGIALRFGPMDSGIIIDSLAWGEASNEFVEGVVFIADPEVNNGNPGANQSMERLSCGQDELCDTDNNLFDFDINTTPSPRNSSPNQ